MIFSAIGFGVVFLACTLSLSAIAGTACWHARDRLRRSGPLVERSAASSALVLPPLFAALLTVALAVRSALAPWLEHGDHCPAHEQHLHLCVFHGASWASEVWAVAALTTACAYVGVSLLQHLALLHSARRRLSRIRAIAKRIEHSSTEIFLAPATVPFCFAAGLWSPEIFISTAAWSRWNDEERRAAIEHERTHVKRRDLLRRSLLSVLALFGMPILSRRALSLWDDASERICDRAAATAIGDPTVVASALLACAKRIEEEPMLASFFSPSIESRIEALLSDVPLGSQAKRLLDRAALALMSILLGTAILFADPLHHVLESLFG